MAEQGKLEAYDKVVAAAYDAILCDDKWNATLAALMELTDAQGGAFLLAEGANAGVTMFETVGLDSALMQDYNKEFGQIDPNPAYKLRHPEVSCLVDRVALDPALIRFGAFHQEFMRPHGLHSSMALTVEPRDCGVIGSFSVHRFAGSEDYASDAIAWALRAQAHLARALSLHARFDMVRQAGLTMLDSLAMPLLLLDESGRIVLMNEAARELCAQEPSIPLRDGRLHLTMPPKSPLGRVMLPGGAGEARLELLSIPVAPSHALAADRQRPMRLVLIEQAERLPRELAGVLSGIFGLTRAEARVCIALSVEGLSPKECAEVFGVSIHTIRAQIKAIMEKTGARRSADLARTVCRLQTLRTGWQARASS